MNEQQNWFNRQIRTGWTVLGAGLLLGIIGVFLPFVVDNLPFNSRIITGLGILLIGLGMAQLMRYNAASKDRKLAGRLINEEKDERLQMIRARAGNRAYWVSAVMIYIGLMWASFGSNGSLPAISPDSLWYFLAAVVILPFGVYVVSLYNDKRNR
jgi:ABC-type uncharacterized transport system permease subunit